MEESKIQRFLTRYPALADVYYKRPPNSAIVLLRRYHYSPEFRIQEIQQFYVDIGSRRISTQALYYCLKAQLIFKNWELKQIDEVLIRENINISGYRARDNVFIEADRVYDLTVRPKNKVLLLLISYKLLIYLLARSHIQQV